MELTQSVERGRTTLPKGSAPLDHGAGRVCATRGCNTLLARYNPGSLCYAHASPRFPRMRGRNRPK